MVATVWGLETHLPSSVAKEVATTSKSLRQKHHPPREDHSQSNREHAPLSAERVPCQHGKPEPESHGGHLFAYFANLERDKGVVPSMNQLWEATSKSHILHVSLIVSLINKIWCIVHANAS